MRQGVEGGAANTEHALDGGLGVGAKCVDREEEVVENATHVVSASDDASSLLQGEGVHGRNIQLDGKNMGAGVARDLALHEEFHGPLHHQLHLAVVLDAAPDLGTIGAAGEELGPDDVRADGQGNRLVDQQRTQQPEHAVGGVRSLGDHDRAVERGRDLQSQVRVVVHHGNDLALQQPRACSLVFPWVPWVADGSVAELVFPCVIGGSVAEFLAGHHLLAVHPVLAQELLPAATVGVLREAHHAALVHANRHVPAEGPHGDGVHELLQAVRRAGEEAEVVGVEKALDGGVPRVLSVRVLGEDVINEYGEENGT